MEYLKLLSILFLFLISPCKNQNPDQQAKEIISLLKEQGVFEGGYILARKAEIHSPGHFLRVFKEEIVEKYPLEYDHSKDNESIKKLKSLELRGEEKNPDKIIHYSDIYEFEGVKFICVFIGYYIDEPTVINNYKHYQGKGVESLVILDDDMKIQTFFSREITYDW